MGHMERILWNMTSRFSLNSESISFLFQNYERVLDLMQEIILATDLAHHIRIFKDVEEMARGNVKNHIFNF